jgi:hypothetical protein
MAGTSKNLLDLFDGSQAGDEEDDFFGHNSSQVATYSPPAPGFNPSSYSPPAPGFNPSSAAGSMRATAPRMGAPASGFRAPRPARLEGGGSLDLNSEAATVPGLVDVNSQADNYIVGDFYSPTVSFPDLGQYQQFVHSVDVPARGRIGKATSASQPRRKNASGGAARASSAVAPSQRNTSLPPRARRDGPARGGRGTTRGSRGTARSGSRGRRSAVNDYEDGSTSMATENPMVGDAFMVDSGEDDDDSDEVL